MGCFSDCFGVIAIESKNPTLVFLKFDWLTKTGNKTKFRNKQKATVGLQCEEEYRKQKKREQIGYDIIPFEQTLEKPKVFKNTLRGGISYS